MYANRTAAIHDFPLNDCYHVAGVGADESVEERIGHMAQQVARLHAQS